MTKSGSPRRAAVDDKYSQAQKWAAAPLGSETGTRVEDHPAAKASFARFGRKTEDRLTDNILKPINSRHGLGAPNKRLQLTGYPRGPEDHPRRYASS